MEKDRVWQSLLESNWLLERAEEFCREEWKSIGGSRMRYHLPENNRLIPLQKRLEAILFSPCSSVDDKMHSVLHRHNLDPPPGIPFAVHQRDWWLALDLPLAEKLRVRQDLSLYQTLNGLINESDAELGRLSTCDPWVKQVPFLFLVQLPGLGVLSALRILAAIGEISRFPSAKHLVGYAGLGASVHQSGETDRGGAHHQGWAQ